MIYEAESILKELEVAPLGRASSVTFDAGSLDFYQDQNGLMLNVRNQALPVHIPIYTFFGHSKGDYFYEVLEYPKDDSKISSIRFTSKANQDRNGNPAEMPDCFYRTVEYIDSRYPGYKECISNFAEGLFVYGVLIKPETIDHGEMLSVGETLNFRTRCRRLEDAGTKRLPLKQDLRAEQKPYNSRAGWLKSTAKGTWKIDNNGDEVELFSDIACRAVIEKDLPQRKGQEFFCIHASVPQMDGSVTDIEFRSVNTLPDSIPNSVGMAVEYLQKNITDQTDQMITMVLGCVGSIIDDHYHSYEEEEIDYEDEDALVTVEKLIKHQMWRLYAENNWYD